MHSQMAGEMPGGRRKLGGSGLQLFTFTRFPKSQWKSIRTSNSIERLHEEFKRRIKTRAALGGNCGNVVLGFDGFRADHHVQS